MMLPIMSDLPLISRSPELMSRSDSALLVVDVQEKLVAAIGAAARIVWNVRRLIDGAKVLGLPVLATEQYPQGLGPTVPELASRLEQRPAKLSFSCRELPELFADLRQRNIEKLLVCGIETHVCIQQTVLDLLADGWRVYVAVDAVGARHELDHQTALRRMESSAPCSRHRGRAAGMVPGRRHAGVQANQPHRARRQSRYHPWWPLRDSIAEIFANRRAWRPPSKGVLSQISTRRSTRRPPSMSPERQSTFRSLWRRLNSAVTSS